jgi:hypothetical protein
MPAIASTWCAVTTRAALFRADGECELRTLSPLQLEKNIEFYAIRISPGAELASAAHFEGTREMFSVARGAAVVVAGTTEHRARCGRHGALPRRRTARDPLRRRGAARGLPGRQLPLTQTQGVSGEQQHREQRHAPPWCAAATGTATWVSRC